MWWGGDDVIILPFCAEPDFSYLDALAPYQPLAMKCVYCPIDTRLNFHQVSKLLKEVQVPTVLPLLYISACEIKTELWQCITVYLIHKLKLWLFNCVYIYFILFCFLCVCVLATSCGVSRAVHSAPSLSVSPVWSDVGAAASSSTLQPMLRSQSALPPHIRTCPPSTWGQGVRVCVCLLAYP